MSNDGGCSSTTSANGKFDEPGAGNEHTTGSSGLSIASSSQEAEREQKPFDLQPPPRLSRKPSLAFRSEQIISAVSAPVASNQLATPAQPQKDGGLDDPLVAFKLLEALRANDLPALDSMLDSLPPSPASPGVISSAPTKTLAALQAGTPPAMPGVSVPIPVQLSPLHLAIQVSSTETAAHIISRPDIDVNARNSKGETPLHVAARAGRSGIVDLLLADSRVNDAVRNVEGKLPDEVAKTDQIAQKIRANREAFVTSRTVMMHQFAHSGDFTSLKELFANPRTAGLVDINHQDPIGGATVLFAAVQHEKGGPEIVRWLIEKGADVFIRDRRGKLPGEIAKNERVRTMLKQFTKETDPSALTTITAPGKPPRMQGLLQKWTNYAAGYKTRWFVLENGILSYYKKQEDTDNACRGSVSLRIAKLSLDPSDPQKFDLIGRGSVRYHLRAEHAVEAKRWIFAITQTKQWLNESADKVYNSNKYSTGSSMASLSALDAPAEGISAGNAIKTAAASVPQHRQHRQEGSGDSTTLSQQDSSSGDGGVRRQYGEPSSADKRGRELTRRGSQEADRSTSPSPESATRPPHEAAFGSTVANINVQLELLGQLLNYLRKYCTTEGSSEQNLGAAEMEAARRSVEQMTSMVTDLVRFANDREVYWKGKYQDEREKEALFVESLRELAVENHQMEQAVRRTMRGKAKSPIGGQKRKELTDAVSLKSGEMAAIAAAEDDGASTDEEEDVFEDALADDGFFLGVDQALQESEFAEREQAVESLSSTAGKGVSVAPAGEPGRASSEKRPGYELADPNKASMKSSSFTVPGYPSFASLRNWLPLPESNSAPELNLWSVIRNSIGKDLSKIALPVYFNEPLSMLQRMAEDMEYSELLDKAAAQRGSTERILYVAAFAMSNYSSTVGRTGKPFNPLLSETYEFSIPDKGFRYVSEQVSHHPPISACHCESANYEFFAEVNVKYKFWGKSLEIYPLGVSYVNLKIPNAWRPEGAPEGEDGKFIEHYSYKKVTTCVNNLIYGKLWVDSYGEMVIRNHTTGDTAVLNFKARKWQDKTPCEIKGEVKASGASSPAWEVWGRWDQKLIARRAMKTSQPLLHELHQQATESDLPSPLPVTSRGSMSTSLTKYKVRPVLVWRRNPMPERPTPFNLTPFAMALNDAPEDVTRYLCPTDCRFRPDQHAVERGEWELADTEKRRLEAKQRDKRKELEKAAAAASTSSLSLTNQGEDNNNVCSNQRHNRPKWFAKSTNPVTGEEYWKFNCEYWKRRDRCVAGESKAEVWPDVEDLY